jgi:hypothetical protein
LGHILGDSFTNSSGHPGGKNLRGTVPLIPVDEKKSPRQALESKLKLKLEIDRRASKLPTYRVRKKK